MPRPSSLKNCRSSLILLAAAVSMLVFSGCAAMPFLNGPQRKSAVSKSGIATPYQDYSGVVHIHTFYSHHSTGSFDEVARAAEKVHVDFAIISDHDTLRWREEKKEGLVNGVLMLIGTEVSSPAGHLVVLGTEKEIDRRQDSRKILEEIHKAKASSFIAHAEWQVNPWTDWTLAPSVTGMEIYNLPAAMYARGLSKMFLKTLLFPPVLMMRSYLHRPDNLLKKWDHILAERKFVGIGSVDAHQRFRLLGKSLDSYETMFRVVQTHALAPGLSRKEILEAFGRGHVYVGFDIVKPVRNFLFVAETPKKRLIMGDKIRFSADLKLRVALPETADIHVLKNGTLWKSVQGNYWESAPEGPGVYRVEVYFEDKLWILSNPIYVIK